MPAPRAASTDSCTPSRSGSKEATMPHKVRPDLGWWSNRSLVGMCFIFSQILGFWWLIYLGIFWNIVLRCILSMISFGDGVSGSVCWQLVLSKRFKSWRHRHMYRLGGICKLGDGPSNHWWPIILWQQNHLLPVSPSHFRASNFWSTEMSYIRNVKQPVLNITLAQEKTTHLQGIVGFAL